MVFLEHVLSLLRMIIFAAEHLTNYTWTFLKNAHTFLLIIVSFRIIHTFLYGHGYTKSRQLGYLGNYTFKWISPGIILQRCHFCRNWECRFEQAFHINCWTWNAESCILDLQFPPFFPLVFLVERESTNSFISSLNSWFLRGRPDVMHMSNQHKFG